MDTERTEYTEFLETEIERFNETANRTFDSLTTTITAIKRDLREVKATLESEDQPTEQGGR